MQRTMEDQLAGPFSFGLIFGQVLFNQAVPGLVRYTFLHKPSALPKRFVSALVGSLPTANHSSDVDMPSFGPAKLSPWSPYAENRRNDGSFKKWPPGSLKEENALIYCRCEMTN